MNIPPLLLAAALALWGERADQWPAAIVLAVLVEAARWLPWRWTLTRRDFDRVADASTLGIVLVAVYAFDEYAFHGVYRLLEWLPLLLAPLLLAQLYSSDDEIRYTSLFLSMRRAYARGLMTGERGVDFRRPYLGACLLAATVNTEDAGAVFWLMLLLLGWLLWSNRPQRYANGVWIAALLVFGAVAVATQGGIIGVRNVVEPAVVTWFQDRIWAHRNPFRAYTAIGHIGRLKQSDAVVLRVTPDADGRVPPLLREAVYQTFSKNIWLAGNATFEPISSDLEGTTWKFRDPSGPSRSVRIGVYLPGGRGMLPLPNGSWQMSGLPAEEVERNPLGALRVTDGPGFAEFDAHYVDTNVWDAPPGEPDLRVPKDLEPLMKQVLGGINIEGLTPVGVAVRLQRFFDEGFSYSVVLKRPTAVSRPLQSFLLETRTGHCEYFATSTVMLLRAAGVPARYVSGWSVQEWNETERRYIVRRRHAHSWVLAWLDGAWREIDTTPTVWALEESAAAPWWEPLYSRISWIAYQWSRWRWQAETEERGNQLLWLVVPLALLLAWRLRRRKRVVRRDARARGRVLAGLPGADSELFLVEARLRRQGMVRGSGESLAHWLRRLEAEGRLPADTPLPGQVLALHNRYRFDPLGLNPRERAALREMVRDWLARAYGRRSA